MNILNSTRCIAAVTPFGRYLIFFVYEANWVQHRDLNDALRAFAVGPAMFPRDDLLPLIENLLFWSVSTVNSWRRS